MGSISSPGLHGFCKRNRSFCLLIGDSDLAAASMEARPRPGCASTPSSSREPETRAEAEALPLALALLARIAAGGRRTVGVYVTEREVARLDMFHTKRVGMSVCLSGWLGDIWYRIRGAGARRMVAERQWRRPDGEQPQESSAEMYTLLTTLP